MRKELYYFAYGSNMNSERMESRVHSARKVGTAVLEGYKLVFDCGYPSHSYANIKEEEGSVVEGVLYKLWDWQICALERFENYPTNYKKAYFLIGDKLCFAFIGSPYFKTNAEPLMYYLHILLDGARENKLYKTVNFLLNYIENVQVPDTRGD